MPKRSNNEDAPEASATFNRGPAADSRAGELLIDVLGIACATGHALDLQQARFLCGATYRLGARGADGSLDRRGFLGGTADMVASSLRLQAPWLGAARAAPREEYLDVERTTRLMRAAHAGDERHVRELVAAGVGVDAACDRGTALSWAAGAGHERVCAALLDAGAAVDSADGDGRTPLIRACIFGHDAVVSLLISRGANQRVAATPSSLTAMHFAVSFDRPRIVDLLCSAPGASEALALRNSRGRSVLGYARWSGGRAAMVASLVARGAPE
jgi:hypothetical protein